VTPKLLTNSILPQTSGLCMCVRRPLRHGALELRLNNAIEKIGQRRLASSHRSRSPPLLGYDVRFPVQIA
jgi:hypothetical protein